MPYTRVWNSSAPNGATTDAADIDVVFHQFRVDIVERMNSIIGGTDFATADPVRFKNIYFGDANGEVWIPTADLTFKSNDGTVSIMQLLASGNIEIPTGDFTVTAGTTNVVDIDSTGQARNVPVEVGSVAVNTALDLDDGNYQRVTLGASGLVLTLSNPKAGSVYVIEVAQDAGGSRAYTFAAGTGSIKWPSGVTPTTSTGANKIDIYSFLFNGTDFCGMQSGANF